MSDWRDYVSEVEGQTFSGSDPYGYFTEYEAELSDELLNVAADQVREYIPHDEYGVEARLRNYDDGRVRVFLSIVDLSGNEYQQEEMELEREILDALEQIPFDEM